MLLGNNSSIIKSLSNWKKVWDLTCKKKADRKKDWRDLYKGQIVHRARAKVSLIWCRNILYVPWQWPFLKCQVQKPMLSPLTYCAYHFAIQEHTDTTLWKEPKIIQKKPSAIFLVSVVIYLGAIFLMSIAERWQRILPNLEIIESKSNTADVGTAIST